jgi:hypothetical protein
MHMAKGNQLCTSAHMLSTSKAAQASEVNVNDHRVHAHMHCLPT